MSQVSPDGYGQQAAGTRRNIRIDNRRTSIKLEPEMWYALIEICVRTKKNINQICTEVHKASLGVAGVDCGRRAGGDAGDGVSAQGGYANFTSELRVFILDYYRAIAR